MSQKIHQSPKPKNDAEIGQALLAHYQALGCQGIITLIQYLLSLDGKQLISLGSSTLGLNEVLKRSDLSEAEKLILADDTIYKLHLGSRRDSETPLQTLLRYTEEWGKMNVIHLPKDSGGTQAISLEHFDVICGELIGILLQGERSFAKGPPKSVLH